VSPKPPSSTKRNFAFTTAFTAVNILYPLITFAYVSRVMGPAFLGRINLATSLASYFTLLAALALPLYGAREIAKVRHDPARLDRVFSELMIINLASTAVALLLYGVCLLIPGRIHADWFLYAVAGLFIASNCVSLDWFFQGIEDFPSTFVRNLCTKIATFLLMVLLVRRSEDYIWVAGIGAASAFGYNLWGLRAALRKVSLRFRGTRPFAHTRPLVWLILATILSSAYVYLDGVLLGFLGGERALGFYSVAIRITRTSHMVVIALTTTMIPRMSSYLESGRRDDYAALGQKSIHAIFFLCFPIYAILTALSPHLVALMAGPQFLKAAATLRYTMPLLPLVGFTHWLGLQILFPRGEERMLFFSAAVGAAVNLGLNLFLIPRFAENGAAWAAVATEACAGLTLLVLVRKGLREFRYWDAHFFNYLVFGLLSGGIAWGAAYCLGADLPASVGGALAGGAFYLGSLWLRKDPLARDMASIALRKGRIALERAPDHA